MADDKEASVKKADPAAFENGALTFDLRKSIQAHGETVSKLTIREPSGEDLIEVGVIFTVGKEGEVQTDAKRFCTMLSRLAAIPESSVKKIHPKDLVVLSWMLTSFFMP